MDKLFARRGRQDHQDHDGGYPKQTAGWNPIAATPTMDSPASPHQRSHFTSFTPMSPPAAAAPDTPSTAGLGIDSVEYAARFPGYYPVVSRDSFEQDSPPRTPQAGDSSKSTLSPEAYALGSPYGNPYYYPSPYGPPSPPSGPGDPRRDSGAGWCGWRLLSGGWPMYAMFFLGFGFAVGHHAFYTRLDGKPADDQIRMMRFGGLLSYAAKASLVAAVLFAYRQQIWVTVIHKVLRLRTIDSLFAAAHDPLALCNWEFVRKARVAACLAVLVWLFPLTVILTPATLTVAPRIETKEDMCHGIRTLNFEQERSKNWRILEKINDFRVLSLSLYNSTVQNSAGMTDVPFNETFFDYFTSSSTQFELVAAQTALTGAVIPRRDATLETCGSGWNCSYTINFTAPGYKCSELARGLNPDRDELKRHGAPDSFNPSMLVPHGNCSYLAETDAGSYSGYQLPVHTGGAPLMDPPYPKHLGAFRTEPVLWVGYVEHTRPGKPPNSRDKPGFDSAFEQVVFRCEHYLTNYSVQFNHTLSGQTTTVLDRAYLRPIINTRFVPGELADDGTLDNTTATPQSNYVLPMPDYRTYRVAAAYYSLGSRLRWYLGGKIDYVPFVVTATEATKTRLIDPETYVPERDLMPAVQRFYENMTLSLLSNPQFMVVTWAAQPGRRSGVSNLAPASPATAYPCVRTRVANAYAYNRRDLWIAYAAAIGSALCAVILGSAALSQNNGRPRDARLSSIVATTRAPCLDGLPWNSSTQAGKWGEVPAEVLDARLGYGVVVESGAGPPSWAAGARRVYYGFAPREVLERGRMAAAGPGRAKNRLSAFSFKTWGENH